MRLLSGRARARAATTDMARMFRAVKTQESILLVLTEEYERAKLQELRDASTVEVLDPATPPLHKSQPHRTMIVAVCFVLAICANAAFVWMRADSAL